MTSEIMNSDYDGETLGDIERDVYDALQDFETETDEHGFPIGTYKVTIEHTNDPNGFYR